ncbi:MAG: hypothetical protein COC06_12290 [Bacteroidales bacterium]|nr:MAG: hypothetical protein COC06_12290 [Bacteroidales bacterium]
MNNKLRYTIWISIVIAFGFLLSHCKTSENRPVIKVGFSQCTMADEWRKQMVKEMKREAALYNDVDIQIIVKDAQNNSLEQKSDIEELIAQKTDILIISPNQSDPLVETIEMVNKLGIPVIVIDRIIETDLPFYTIGGNNYNIGKMAGEQAQKLLPYGGKILVLTGLTGSTPAQQRHEGFEAGIKSNESLLISAVIQSDWTEELAEKQMIEYLNNNTEFDLIFAHNDFMAKGVIKAFKKTNTRLKPIIGIDGLNAPGYGIDMVLDSTLRATITYPTGGDKAIETAYKIYKKQNISKQQELSSILINLSNAASIRLQRNEIELQQSKIDRQIKVLSDKDHKIDIQKRQLKSVFILLALSGLLVFIILFFLSKPFIANINK